MKYAAPPSLQDARDQGIAAAAYPHQRFARLDSTQQPQHNQNRAYEMHLVYFEDNQLSLQLSAKKSNYIITEWSSMATVAASVIATIVR